MISYALGIDHLCLDDKKQKDKEYTYLKRQWKLCKYRGLCWTFKKYLARENGELLNERGIFNSKRYRARLLR